MEAHPYDSIFVQAPGRAIVFYVVDIFKPEFSNNSCQDQDMGLVTCAVKSEGLCGKMLEFNSLFLFVLMIQIKHLVILNCYGM